MVAPKPTGHSSKVRLEVRAGGCKFRVAQIGAGRLVFDSPVLLPGTSGEAVAHIDDREQRWSVTWEKCVTPQRIISAEFQAIE